MISGLPLYKVILPDTDIVFPSYCRGFGNCAALADGIKAVKAQIHTTHVQENVALPGLVNAIHGAGYPCRFPNVLRCFHGRVADTLSNDRSSADKGEKREQCLSFHGRDISLSRLPCGGQSGTIR